MNIKVLGSGCERCVAFAKNTEKAVKSLALNTEVKKIFDMEEVKRHQVDQTPALLINDEIITYGKNLLPDEIAKLINELKTQ